MIGNYFCTDLCAEELICPVELLHPCFDLVYNRFEHPNPFTMSDVCDTIGSDKTEPPVSNNTRRNEERLTIYCRTSCELRCT